MDDGRGFEEVPHTADWAMRVWARDLPSLFEEAARGLNALSGARIRTAEIAHRTFEYEAADAESLLVSFLSELVYLQEQERLGFSHFQITLDGLHLRVEMEGGPLASLEKPIKAVTFHNLRIQRNGEGYAVQVVFDV